MNIRPYENYPFSINEFLYVWRMHDREEIIDNIDDFHKLMEIIVFRKTYRINSNIFVTEDIRTTVNEFILGIEDDGRFLTAVSKLINDINSFDLPWSYKVFKRLYNASNTESYGHSRNTCIILSMILFDSSSPDHLDSNEVYDIIYSFAIMCDFNDARISTMVNLLDKKCENVNKMASKLKLLHGNKFRANYHEY